MAAVSIIVPVYNTEKYLRKCIDSILSQSFHDIEVILVDDGSLDKSGEICDNYAKKDNRIRVIHQENGGVSVARQTGLDASTGEYLIHVDPDDWIENNEIEDLYKKAKTEDLDLVLCDSWDCHLLETTYHKIEIVCLSVENLIDQLLNGTLDGCCWNKLVRKRCLDDAKVSFRPKHITYLEDLLFWTRLLKDNELKIGYVPNAYYHYNTYNTNSLTNKKSLNCLHSLIDVLSEIEKMYDKNKYNQFYAIKSAILFTAFVLKQFHIVKYQYNEIKPQLINKKKRYNPFTPKSSCMSLALRGYPHIAYYCYIINMKVINARIKFKSYKRFFLSKFL